MQHILDQATRVAIDATVSTAVAVDGGPTPEQRRMLHAVRTRVLGLTGPSGRLGPADAAAVLIEPSVRRVVCEALVALELMRHPSSPALVTEVERYLDALGGGVAEQALVRDAVAGAREQLIADYARVATPSPTTGALADARGADVFERLRTLGRCPTGSLGRSFHDFYERNGFELPGSGAGPGTTPSLIGHDFAHVLGGYEPTPEGELALQALLVTATRGERHFSGLLASLLLFEVGMLPFPDIEPKTEALDRPGAADLFADAIRRGMAVEGDLQSLDHLALAERDLVELRRELGLAPPPTSPSTFVI